MKVSLNWVREFTDVTLPVDELVEKIGAQLGAVEEVIDLGKKYQGIVVAKVVSCVKHPNADKLKICSIDDGGNTPRVKRDKDGYVQVVCGAPNVREGLLVAWLPPGTIVPNTFDKEPFKLEARDIRGVVSNGMLASAHELALSDDHTGILELSLGEIGGDFAITLGLDDHIIDIENKMFTHRPDLFGILGVAREIAGITSQQFKSPEWYQEKSSGMTSESSMGLAVSNKIPDLVPRFMARVIEDVEIKHSPAWMQAYLSRVGIRPINNIVDVTNYTMYLTAQPLHAYDYDKLCKVAGTVAAQLETRLGKKGDKIKLLNGKELVLDEHATILITSNNIPVGIGGVMGGAETEVDENTKNIILECANFDMYTIRRTSMHYGLFTDAVTRFNKGQSSLQNPAVLQKAVGWVTHLAGGKPGKTIDDHQELRHPAAVRVSEQFINGRLGLDLPADDIQVLLENVEFTIERTDNKKELKIKPPFWRTDIEIPEDIVEEVGRLYGYDRLPLELPKRDLTPVASDKLIELKTSIRTILAKAGANELLTYSFVHGNLLDTAGQDRKKAYELSNALSPDLQYYRQSLTPSLLEKVHANIKVGFDEFAVFEIGKVHLKTEIDKEGLPREFDRVALVYAASDKIISQDSGAAYFQAQKFASHLLDKLGIGAFRLEIYDFDLSNNPLAASRAAPFEPTRRSAILATINGQDDVFVGIIGEYTAETAKKLKLSRRSAGFELEVGLLDQLIKQNTASRYTPLSRFPSVSQDISLKVPADLPFADLFNFIQQNLSPPKNTHHTLEPIDIYQRDGDKSHKQTTLRLQIASYEKTMTDAEVNKLLEDAAAKAHAQFGAERL